MAKALTKRDMDDLDGIGRVELDPETLDIARFGELIEKLTEMISSQSKRTTADLARSQVQLEILATLQKNVNGRQGVTKLQQDPLDLSPLREVIEEITRIPEAVDYDFNIIHMNGVPVKIEARVVRNRDS